VLSSGEENCDFKWKQIQDDGEFEARNIFETTYWMLGGKDDPTTVQAFTVGEPINAVYFYNTDIEVIVHEIEHVKCILENKDETLRELCHFRIDMDYTVQGTRPQVLTPESPIISEKMKYTNQFNW
jgi:hypothetical protein